LAQASISNDQTDEEQIETKESKNKTENNKQSYQDQFILHYTYEKRVGSTKRDMHRIHGDVFQNTPTMQVKMIVGNRNRRAAVHDLIRKKPKKSILTNKLFKSTYYFTKTSKQRIFRRSKHFFFYNLERKRHDIRKTSIIKTIYEDVQKNQQFIHNRSPPSSNPCQNTIT
jgi:hypothetical protein